MRKVEPCLKVRYDPVRLNGCFLSETKHLANATTSQAFSFYPRDGSVEIKPPRIKSLIKVFFDINEIINITFNFEVKTNMVGHARLPDTIGLVIFLRTKRWMPHVD